MTCLINFYYSSKPDIDYIKHLYNLYKPEKMINVINAKPEDTYLEYHPYFELFFDINFPPNKRSVYFLVTKNIVAFLNGYAEYNVLNLVNDHKKYNDLIINTADLPDFLVPKLRILLKDYQSNIVDNRRKTSWLLH